MDLLFIVASVFMILAYFVAANMFYTAILTNTAQRLMKIDTDISNRSDVVETHKTSFEFNKEHKNLFKFFSYIWPISLFGALLFGMIDAIVSLVKLK